MDKVTVWAITNPIDAEAVNQRPVIVCDVDAYDTPEGAWFWSDAYIGNEPYIYEVTVTRRTRPASCHSTAMKESE